MKKCSIILRSQVEAGSILFIKRVELFLATDRSFDSLNCLEISLLFSTVGIMGGNSNDNTKYDY